MTAAAAEMAPLTDVQRRIARLIGLDTTAQDARIERTEDIRRRSIRARLSAERIIGSYRGADKALKR